MTLDEARIVAIEKGHRHNTNVKPKVVVVAIEKGYSHNTNTTPIKHIYYQDYRGESSCPFLNSRNYVHVITETLAQSKVTTSN